MPEPTAPFRPLDAERVRRSLAGSRFADVRYVAQTGSTNDDATALLAHHQARGATLVAEEQTAGHGRRAGRSWIALPGTSLLFTTLLPEPVATDRLWSVPFWIALAVADGFAGAGIEVELRWPNDIYLNGRKAAGILCISRVSGAAAHAGCGVGINVNRPALADLTAIEPPPAFLSDIVPGIERETVLTGILLACERKLSSLADADATARAYETRACLAGTRYRVRLDADGSELEGIARGLGPEGTLRLDAGGIERCISLADVRRL